MGAWAWKLNLYTMKIKFIYNENQTYILNLFMIPEIDCQRFAICEQNKYKERKKELKSNSCLLGLF